MTNPIYPPEGTQEWRVLQRLLKAEGGWINKQVFVREMFLTQAGRAIWNLENRYGWPVEHSGFKDDHGFKSYRLFAHAKQLSLI